ncbi:hypothetical protein HII31_11272 [Pseudocercospora fuligena]|uniref:Uncharacterized protein n=1 Tax=Pseudocercospora fuligena TaxID=685502 RepID=A0A8H6RAB1_9PEZI|nr:hypothetical protein HII31_11272 [Pseudocercospora fuligena]
MVPACQGVHAPLSWLWAVPLSTRSGTGTVYRNDERSLAVPDMHVAILLALGRVRWAKVRASSRAAKSGERGRLT